MIRVTPPTAATTATTPIAAPTFPSVESRTALLHRARIFGSCPGYRAGAEVLVRRPPHFGCLDRSGRLGLHGPGRRRPPPDRAIFIGRPGRRHSRERAAQMIAELI